MFRQSSKSASAKGARSTNKKKSAHQTKPKNKKFTTKTPKPQHVRKIHHISTSTVCSPGRLSDLESDDEGQQSTTSGPLFPKDPKPLFLLCDIQEPFRDTMTYFPRLVASSKLLLNFAKEMKYPVYVSEQLPFAGTVPELRSVLDTFPPGQVSEYKKKTFSMVPDMPATDWSQYNSVVLFGIESHVCIIQTYADLTQILPPEVPIYLVTDATFSQRRYDRTSALRTMIDATQITSETLLYGFMGTAANPHFKAMLPHVKEAAKFIREGDMDVKYDV